MKKKYLILMFMLFLLTTVCACGNAPVSEVNKDIKDSSGFNQVGIIGDGISVPESVMTAARGYVQEEFDYWSKSSGCSQLIEGEQQMVGEPSTYDNWRIEGLSMIYQYENLENQKLELYQIDYRLHTTTPDKVIIAGGMDLDDEGWLLPTYPNSTYLVFSVEDEETPIYLFSLMENDCSPGDELFTSDLINALRKQDSDET